MMRGDLKLQATYAKVNFKTLSSCLVYVFRASYITVYGGIRRLLFPHCFQLLIARWSTGRGTILRIALVKQGRMILCSRLRGYGV